MLPPMSLSPRFSSRSLFRFSFLFLALAPAVASAQMSQGPPTPLVTDLAKVPSGSWAQYSMKVGTMPPMTMKMALVGKSPAGNIIEMSVEGGATAKLGKVVTQVTLQGGADGVSKPQKLVIQMGPNDPMEMQTGGAQGQFAKPDPKTLVKEETLKVAAGSFKTKHYRNKTAQGDSVDSWVAESAAPIGLVKMEMTQKSNPMVTGPITMELTAVGKDAKPSITKAPKPYDQAAFMKQVMGGPGVPPAK
jgi:hypothetical protein